MTVQRDLPLSRLLDLTLQDHGTGYPVLDGKQFEEVEPSACSKSG